MRERRGRPNHIFYRVEDIRKTPPALYEFQLHFLAFGNVLAGTAIPANLAHGIQNWQPIGKQCNGMSIFVNKVIFKPLKLTLLGEYFFCFFLERLPALIRVQIVVMNLADDFFRRIT